MNGRTVRKLLRRWRRSGYMNAPRSVFPIRLPIEYVGGYQPMMPRFEGFKTGYAHTRGQFWCHVDKDNPACIGIEEHTDLLFEEDLNDTLRTALESGEEFDLPEDGLYFARVLRRDWSFDGIGEEPEPARWKNIRVVGWRGVLFPTRQDAKGRGRGRPIEKTIVAQAKAHFDWESALESNPVLMEFNEAEGFSKTSYIWQDQQGFYKIFAVKYFQSWARRGFSAAVSRALRRCRKKGLDVKVAFPVR